MNRSRTISSLSPAPAPLVMAALAGALAALPVAAQISCPIDFGPNTTTPGPAPAAGARLSTGDFNGDGLADVTYAVAGPSAAVFLRSTTVTFAAPVTYPAGTSPRTTKVVDLDHDGILDILAVNITTGVIWLRGAGDGTFHPGQILALGSVLLDADAGDLNGDGLTDIVSVSNSGTVRVVLSSGEWPAYAQTQVLFGGIGLVDVGIGDFNADGRPDLAALGPTFLRIFPGAPEGAGVGGGGGPSSFAAPVDYPVPADPQSLAVADLNHDGRADIAVAAATGSSLAVYFGRMGSSMVQPATPFGIAGPATDVAVDDLNLDGKLDLVAACPAEGVVCVLEGMGGNAFRAFRSIAAGPSPVSVSLADADGSGYPDLLVMNESPAGVSVRQNTAASPYIFFQPVGITVAEGAPASFQAATEPGAPLTFQWRRNGEPIADDGRVSGSNTGLLSFSHTLASDSGDAFDCVISSPCETLTSYPAALVVTPAPSACLADFNADGNLDPDDLGDFINAYFAGCP
ncbi:MAG: FG-GAP-like repeat-containing protein [Phycisphaerales bacterium]